MVGIGNRIKLKHALIIVAVIALMPFQNCGMVPQGPMENGSADGGGGSSNTSTNTSTGSSGSDTGSNSGGTGWNSSGTGTTGGSSGTGGSTGYYSGGSGTGTTQPPPTTINTALRITTDLKSLTLGEGANFEFGFQFSGGYGPFDIQWFHDGQPMDSDYFGTIYYGQANRYEIEGEYYVVVTDKNNGSKVQTSKARITIIDNNVPCVARPHYTATVNHPNFTYYYSLFATPRGQVMHPATQAELSPMNLDSFNGTALSYIGLARFNGFPNAGFGQRHGFACKTTIPGIHQPTPNPGGYGGDDWWYSQYEDSTIYKYEGSIDFECRGNKWILKSNNCNWKYYPPPPDTGGGGA